MGPDSFEAALQEELVKLHRRLLVEHRKYSATLVGSKSSLYDKRRSLDGEATDTVLEVGQAASPDHEALSAGQAAQQEESALDQGAQGKDTLLTLTRGKDTLLTLTSHEETIVNAVVAAEEAKVAAAVEEEESGSKVDVEGLVERLESVCDSNSDPDLNIHESEADANQTCEKRGSHKDAYESEAKDSEPPGMLADVPDVDVSDRVKNCPVAAAAAATAMLRASKASATSVMCDPPRTLRRKISFARSSANEIVDPETPMRGRWRRQSIGTFAGERGRNDRSDRDEARKPSLANLTDQLAETLRTDMRRPSITSLRSSDRHSMGSPRMSHGFDVLPVWKRSVLANARSRMTTVGLGNLARRNSTIAQLQPGAPEEEGGAVKVQLDKSYLSVIIMSPSALPRLCWDFLAMLLILYDCLVIPMMVFEEELSFAQGMVWITRIFWTVNVPISALTGFLKKDGTVEMRPQEVFKNYLRSWFLPDMLVITIDWAEVLVNVGSGGWSRFGNVLRLLRIVRVVRIVRFIKAPEVMDFFNEYIRSEEVMLIASLAKVICLTLSVAHVIACLWYGVGRISSNDDNRWIKMSQTEDMKFGQQYLVSFHWSLAQFAGELIIEPQNDSERAFTVVVLFLAIIGSSMFVSSLTTSMTRLQILSSKQSSQLATLRRFLLDRNISRPLATRVQQNAQYALMEQKKDIPEASVDLLSMISNPLLVELHYEIYSHTLLEHPFFQCYNHINPGGVQKVCNQCVRLLTMYKGDLLFSDFEVPSSKRMYIIVNGSLQYSQPRRLQIPATKGQWMCEAFLWTHWSHCGTARAHQTSRLLALDAEKFQSIIATFPTPHARHYAELFVEAINEYEVDELTDLETLMDELDDLIEEAFPVEQDEADVASADSDGGSQDSVSLGGSSEHGAGSQSSADVGKDRRASFSRQSTLRRSGELRPDRPDFKHGRSQKSLAAPGSGTRRVSGTMRHSRASLVAKKLSRLSRKGSMSEKSPHGWHRASFWDVRNWGAELRYRCSCCYADHWSGLWRDVRERFGNLRRSRPSDTRPNIVQPFSSAMPNA